MKTSSRALGTLALCSALFFTAALEASAAAPRLNFSDITSGPNTGNSDTSRGQAINENGALVTIWGNNLGASQGSSSLTINGATVGSPLIYYWGNAVSPHDVANLYISHNMQMVIFQVPAAAASGPGTIRVTVSGVNSNTLPFTVRAGIIRFIAPTGSTTNPGTFQSPWEDQTVLTPGGSLFPAGAIAYMRGGTYTAIEGGTRNASLYIPVGESGVAGSPKSLVGYPGEIAVLGNGTVNDTSVRGPASYWTVAKLRMVAAESGIHEFKGTGRRGVGIEMFGIPSPYGTFGMQACTDCQVFGNHIYNSGQPGNKLSHLIYYAGHGGSGDNVEIAWNHLHDQLGGRGIQIFGHDNTDVLTNLSIHDNVVHDTPYDGILVGAGTASNWIKDVKVYNNVVHHVAAASVGLDAGIRINNGGLNPARVFNNTLYMNPRNLNLAQGVVIEARNNILASPTTPTQAVVGAGVGTLTLDRNVYFSPGTYPSQEASPITGDPKFVNVTPTLEDFRLQSGSSAMDSGSSLVSTVVTHDLDGTSRPQGSGYDLGAYEFVSGAPTPAVTIVATDASAGEPSNNGLFTVTASPAPPAPITVNLTRGGTATNGTDYASIATTVAVGTSGSATIPVTAIDNAVSEPSETVILTVTAGTGYVVGTPNSATVTITDNDPPPGTPFVTGQTLGTLRNNVTASGGFKFTVGSSPMTVSELGRWVVAGNSQAHTVKLVVASTGANVSGGSVSIATAGAPAGQFKYAALAAPVTLAANTAYYVVSGETNGGDQWYDGNTTLTHTSAAVINSAIYSLTGSAPWTATFSTNNSYIPVSFKTTP
ncbi:MAG: choice-of-anchor Q domain-containing protein [Opitutaceae bacterium]